MPEAKRAVETNPHAIGGSRNAVGMAEEGGHLLRVEMIVLWSGDDRIGPS